MLRVHYNIIGHTDEFRSDYSKHMFTSLIIEFIEMVALNVFYLMPAAGGPFI